MWQHVVMKRFSIAIAVGTAVMLILWSLLSSNEDGRKSSVPDLCSNYVGPAFIVSDESESNIAFRTATGLYFLSLDSRKVDRNIPMQARILAVSMPREKGVLALALSEYGGTRISTIGSGDGRTRDSALFDALEVELAAFTPDGKYLVGTTRAGDAFRVTLDSKRIQLTKNVGSAASSIAVSPTSKKLYVAGDGLTVIDVEQMKILSTLAKESRLLEVAASNDDNVFATRDLRNINLVNVGGSRGDEKLSSIAAEDQPTAASIRSTGRMAFSSDGSTLYYLAASDTKSELVAFSAVNLQIKMRLPIASHPNALALLPDHNWVVITAGVVGNEQLEIVDMNTQTTILGVPLERSRNRPACSRDTIPDKAA